MEKAIKYLDPEEKWNIYSGQVKLNTSFPFENTFGTELIEIDVACDYYKCTRIAGEFKIEKGVKDGIPFRSINNNYTLNEEEIDKFGLTDEGIVHMKEWH